jgi:hypothetical protein
MDQILPQAMKFQVVENMMLKSVPYSLHLLKNLACRFTHNVLEQACLICSFPIKGTSATQPCQEFIYGLFGWGGFGLMDLDLRAQIQILCLDDFKSLGFGFGPNPSRILKDQIYGFQMIS